LDTISKPPVREIRYRRFSKYEIRVLKWYLVIKDIDLHPILLIKAKNVPEK
jgi:hypothetical protein